MKNKRGKRGSVTAFAAVLALALLVLGIGFLFIVLYMGAQRETKNATDAGALNVGKQALTEISVPLGFSDDQRVFEDCASDSFDNNNFDPLDRKINLKRINRVWSKAMLIAINAEAAAHDLSNAGSGASNADNAFSGAKSISDQLATKLTTPSNLHGFFDDLSGQNSARMIGINSSTKVLPGPGWKTSLMDREAESNVQLTGGIGDKFYLPRGYTLPSDCYTKSKRSPVPSAVSDTYFLKGYSPLTVGGNTFWQVPFKWDNKPQLVASSSFDAETAAAKSLEWANPVPNAYSVEGQALKPGAAGEKASSWVLSNPRKPFKLAAPHSFLHIKVDQPKCKWYFYSPIKTSGLADQDYDFTAPSTLTGAPMAGPLSGILCSLVSPPPQEIGLDIFGRSLDDVIFSLPNLHTSETAQLESYMVNRANEMISKPGVVITASDLHSCLDDPKTRLALLSGVIKDFYLFSPDGETLQCLPKVGAMAMALKWLPLIIDKDPDGTESKIIDDDNIPGGVPPFLPHVPTPDFGCSPTPGLNWSWVLWDKDVYWQPGTGYNGCLGQIRVKRWSEVHTVGVCNPF